MSLSREKKEILPFRGRNPKGGPERDFEFTQRACDGRGELDLSFIVFGPFPSLLASRSPSSPPIFKDASPSEGKKGSIDTDSINGWLRPGTKKCVRIQHTLTLIIILMAPARSL